MSTQSIRDSSCIKLSSENLEKSRTRGLSGAPLTTIEPVKQNCEKWSLISEIMLPLMIFSLTLLVNILSINEKELLCTRVGLSIQGAKLRLWPPVPEKTISANRELNPSNRGRKFVLRLDCVPENTISTIPGLK